MTKRIVPTLMAGMIAAACVRSAPPRVVTVPSVGTNGANGSNAASAATGMNGPSGPSDTISPPAPVAQQGSVSPATADNASSLIRSSSRLSAADVARRATDVFGGAPLPANVAIAAVASDSSAAPSWDIDVRSYESTERVDHYVRLFSGPARERIQARLERGTRYEPMIRAKLREGGLPEDMYYLALVESGFDPNAYSRAAAVGMWQFMTSTARDVGMRVDWWVDERRDPMKSTDGAVRFLKELNDQFGSLYLAAAAYNGGPGRIARGLTRYADDFEGTAGDDLFFALADKDYLRNETREYVPQLIAAALIAKEPARYGMTLTPLPPLVYDSVRVGPMTPLAAVARASGASLADVQDLNPQVLRGVTPPADSFFVRVPVGTADGYADAFAALPKSERIGMLKVESKKGESVASIAKHSGITTMQLASYNPTLKRLKSGNLAAGQLVLVPTLMVAAAATSAPDPTIERYSAVAKSSAMHVVKAGESLSGIAKTYHTSTSALMKANGLKRPLILPGQSLVVGGAKKSAVKAKAEPKKVAAKKAPRRKRPARTTSTGSR